MDNVTIILTREQAEKLYLEITGISDDGPKGEDWEEDEGWMSDEMHIIMKIVDDALRGQGGG